MPDPEGPAHRGWLDVVTGIRLIDIMAAATAERHGGLLVYLECYQESLPALVASYINEES